MPQIRSIFTFFKTYDMCFYVHVPFLSYTILKTATTIVTNVQLSFSRGEVCECIHICEGEGEDYVEISEDSSSSDSAYS